jgi:hypothetical protein
MIADTKRAKAKALAYLEARNLATQKRTLALPRSKRVYLLNII